jgi:hypothetical protein
MTRREQANKVSGAVYNERKESEDIPTEHAHIERFRIGDGRVLPMERHFSATRFRQTHLGVNQYGFGHSSEAAKLLIELDALQSRNRQRGRVEDRAVGPTVHEEFHVRPGAIGCKHLSAAGHPLGGGRSTPSSQRYHSPRICIDAGYSLAGDAAEDAAVVFRVGLTR